MCIRDRSSCGTPFLLFEFYTLNILFIYITLLAVSYTHLDVYKRQLLMSLMFEFSSTLPEATVNLNISDVYETLNSVVIRLTVFLSDRKELEHFRVKGGIEIRLVVSTKKRVRKG